MGFEDWEERWWKLRHTKPGYVILSYMAVEETIVSSSKLLGNRVWGLRTQKRSIRTTGGVAKETTKALREKREGLSPRGGREIQRSIEKRGERKKSEERERLGF